LFRLIVTIAPARHADGIAQSEADHFMESSGCCELFDTRDLSEVFEHCHDALVCEQMQ
jgi:hypothetical protein